MANQWFRMYAEFAHDPKVQMLSESMQRRYIMLMCMRCSNELVTLQDEEVAFHLRISNDEWVNTKRLFIEKGFIDGALNLINWDKRQFKSDSSAERVAKHRAKSKAAKIEPVTLQVTEANALDTDTDTDTDKEAKASSSTAPLPDCPHSEIIQLFAEHLPELPQPRAELWDGQRAKALTARWRWCLTAKRADGRRYATDRNEAVQWFGKFFSYVRRCPHLMGENDRNWTADLGWLVKADNFAKVQQGNYDHKQLEAA